MFVAWLLTDLIAPSGMNSSPPTSLLAPGGREARNEEQGMRTEE
jgi:hypothetical protein